MHIIQYLFIGLPTESPAYKIFLSISLIKKTAPLTSHVYILPIIHEDV